MEDQTAPDVRYIIRHTPGPQWRQGIDFREQEGIEAHVNHFRGVHAKGQLEIGGPFLIPDMGGPMISIEGLTEEVVRQIAASDPAVQTGLLNAEVRPWFVAMRRAT